MKAEARALLETLNMDPEETRFAHVLCERLPDRIRARSMWLHLGLTTAQRTHGPAIAPLEPLIRACFDSAFGMCQMADAIACCFALVHAVYPDMPLLDACDRWFAKALIDLRDEPAIQTLIRVSEGNFGDYVRYFSTMERLFYTGTRLAIDLDAEQKRATVHGDESVLFIAYVLPGWWRAMLELLDTRGDVSVAELSAEGVEIRAQWG